MEIKVVNYKGEEVKTLSVRDDVFAVPANTELVHRAVVTLLANRRHVYAHTKDRGQVSGGGKKPWKQKGTGRARHGSIRSPLWVGGGITFGPQPNRNFSLRMNKKEQRAALCMALSDKLEQSQLIVVDNLSVEMPKTKTLQERMKALQVTRSAVVVSEDAHTRQAAKNLQDVLVLRGGNVNVYDILRHRYLVCTEESVRLMESLFGGK